VPITFKIDYDVVVFKTNFIIYSRHLINTPNCLFKGILHIKLPI